MTEWQVLDCPIDNPKIDFEDLFDAVEKVDEVEEVVYEENLVILTHELKNIVEIAIRRAAARLGYGLPNENAIMGFVLFYGHCIQSDKEPMRSCKSLENFINQIQSEHLVTFDLRDAKEFVRNMQGISETSVNEKSKELLSEYKKHYASIDLKNA